MDQEERLRAVMDHAGRITADAAAEKASRKGELTRAEQIALDRFLQIITDEKHPKHATLKDFLKNTPAQASGPGVNSNQ